MTTMIRRDKLRNARLSLTSLPRVGAEAREGERGEGRNKVEAVEGPSKVGEVEGRSKAGEEEGRSKVEVEKEEEEIRIPKTRMTRTTRTTMEINRDG